MAKAKEENQLVEKNINLPAETSCDFEQYAAENDVRDLESDEIITPRLVLLQGASPQVKKSSADYVQGAEEGHIFNTGTKKIYDGAKGILIIPCYHHRIYNEWIPKDSGGGLVKRWGSDESFKRDPNYQEEKGKYQSFEFDDKGNRKVKTEIIKTADHYVLIIDEETGEFTPAVLGFSGTKYKVHRKFANDIAIADLEKKDGTGTIVPPSFSRAYRITTIPESNADNSWFIYRFERVSGNIKKNTPPQIKNLDAIIKTAIEFRKLAIEGTAKVAEDIQEGSTTNDAETI